MSTGRGKLDVCGRCYRRMLKRLAISAMPQSLLSKFNTLHTKRTDPARSAAEHLHWHASSTPPSFPTGISKWSRTKRNERTIHDAFSVSPPATQIHAEPVTSTITHIEITEHVHSSAHSHKFRAYADTGVQHLTQQFWPDRELQISATRKSHSLSFEMTTGRCGSVTVMTSTSLYLCFPSPWASWETKGKSEVCNYHVWHERQVDNPALSVARWNSLSPPTWQETKVGPNRLLLTTY